MRYIHLSSDFQNYNIDFDIDKKYLVLQWQGPMSFPANASVGLKEITLTPLANKWSSMANTECFFVSCNFGNGGLFNPRKKLAAVPVAKHSSYIHHFYDNPGEYSKNFMTHQ